MLLGNAGEPHRIAHEGKVYTFHLLDQTRRNAVEKRFYQQAREGVYVDREHMSSEEYLKRLDRIREEYESGAYAFFGEKGAKLLQTPKGALLLLCVITGEEEADLLPLLAARKEEVNTLLKTVMEESFVRRPVKKVADG